MKINITKSTLLEGIQIVSAGVSSRTTLPILHNFLIEAQSGKIKLVRTDMEMATVHFVNAEVEEEGSLTVPMKEFSDIIKNLPDDKEINLYSDENNKFHIKSGKSKFWVIGTPKSEYPAIPEVERENSVALDPIELQKMIDKTAFSASTQETRYILNGLLWNNTAEKFEIEKAPESPFRPKEKHTFGMYLDGEWYCLKAKSGTFDESDPVAALDVSILQQNLISPVLGIDDPRTDKRIDFVGGIRGLGELERRAQSDMMLAFSMYPTTTDDLMDIADAGKIMPPKSTWFEPKLLSGLFVHKLR